MDDGRRGGVTSCTTLPSEGRNSMAGIGGLLQGNGPKRIGDADGPSIQYRNKASLAAMYVICSVQETIHMTSVDHHNINRSSSLRLPTSRIGLKSFESTATMQGCSASLLVFFSILRRLKRVCQHTVLALLGPKLLAVSHCS